MPIPVTRIAFAVRFRPYRRKDNCDPSYDPATNALSSPQCSLMADQEGTMADTIPPIHSPNDSIEVQRDTLSRRIEYFARLSRLSTNSGDQASISAQQNNDMERLSNLPSDKSKLRHTIWFTADGNATVIMTAYELPYDNRVRGKYARGCLQEMRERMQLASVDPQIASDIEDRIQRAVDENTHSLAVTEGLTEAQLAEIGFR
jgi:hypothetical protein